MEDRNIHNWQEVLKSGNSPYSNSTWIGQKPYMAFLLKYAQPGTWLDVGCGIGFFVECCQRYGINCIGIEGDPNASQIAKERFVDIQIQTHDILEPFPFPDQSFSAVFSNQVIEHIPESKTNFVFSEIFRVLKNDGVAFINMPNIYNIAGRKEPSNINLMSPRRLIKYATDSGFTQIIPTVYPKYIFGRNFISKIFSGILFLLMPLDVLSSNSAVIAVKKQVSVNVKSKRYFYINKLLSW